MSINKEFEMWAAKHGIPGTIVETLIKTAPPEADLDPEVLYHFSHRGDIMP